MLPEKDCFKAHTYVLNINKEKMPKLILEQSQMLLVWTIPKPSRMSFYVALLHLNDTVGPESMNQSPKHVAAATLERSCLISMEAAQKQDAQCQALHEKIARWSLLEWNSYCTGHVAPTKTCNLKELSKTTAEKNCCLLPKSHLKDLFWGTGRKSAWRKLPVAEDSWNITHYCLLDQLSYGLLAMALGKMSAKTEMPAAFYCLLDSYWYFSKNETWKNWIWINVKKNAEGRMSTALIVLLGS